MICPNCHYTDLRPTRTDGAIRTYVCYKCSYQFETVEQVRAAVQLQAFQAAMFNILNGERKAK